MQKNKLKTIFFTDRKRCKDLELAIKKLPKKSTVIFREYDLQNHERENLAYKIYAICKKNNHQILIGKNPDLARKLRADGVHFSDHDKLPLTIFNRQKWPKNFILSFAAHSFLSILKMQELSKINQPNWIFISPAFVRKKIEINPQKNFAEKKIKLGEIQQPLGFCGLSKIIKKSKIPIFVLGGVNQKNLLIAKKLGAKGFGAIEYLIKAC